MCGTAHCARGEHIVLPHKDVLLEAKTAGGIEKSCSRYRLAQAGLAQEGEILVTVGGTRRRAPARKAELIEAAAGDEPRPLRSVAEAYPTCEQIGSTP